MTNFRYGGYLLIAMGLINFRYHTGHANNLVQSIILITLPGALLLGATFVKRGQAALNTQAGKIFSLALVIVSVLWAGLNK